MQGKVELSGVNTSKLPLLKNSEMRELIAASQSGDAAAREKLISSAASRNIFIPVGNIASPPGLL